MSGLRAEDVKEALDDVMKCWTEQRPASVASLMPLMEAARLWLASQEQTPNYARALAIHDYLCDRHGRPTINGIQTMVDAALVGFHPQPEGDER